LLAGFRALVIRSLVSSLVPAFAVASSAVDEKPAPQNVQAGYQNESQSYRICKAMEVGVGLKSIDCGVVISAIKLCASNRVDDRAV